MRGYKPEDIYSGTISTAVRNSLLHSPTGELSTANIPEVFPQNIRKNPRYAQITAYPLL